MDLRLIFLLLLFACQNNQQREILAKFDGMALYQDEVIQSVPQLKSNQDTIAFLNQRAEEWMRSKMLLQEAKKSIDLKKINPLVENYQNELIILQFEKNLLDNALDTFISPTQIEQFAQREHVNFETEEELIKVKFGKFKSTVADLEKLDKFWDEKKWDKVEEYCGTFAEICLLKDEWQTLTELKQFFPDKVFDQNVFNKVGYSQKSFDSFEYFLSIVDYQEKSEGLSTHAKEKIKKLILLERSNKILKSYKEDLYNRSLENQKIKFYLN